jgi:hypothetical protein
MGRRCSDSLHDDFTVGGSYPVLLANRLMTDGNLLTSTLGIGPKPFPYHRFTCQPFFPVLRWRETVEPCQPPMWRCHIPSP